MTRKKILYITELFPYPADSGAKIKTINTIQTLSKEFNIILVCFTKEPILKKDVAYIEKVVHSAHIFTIPTLDDSPKDNYFVLIQNYIKRTPHLVFQFYSKKAHSKIASIIADENPDIIHIDHLNMCQYLPKVKKQIWIHESHNVEHQLAWNKFLAFPAIKKTKLFLFIEYLFILFYEKKFYKKFDLIFTISDYDKALIKKIHNGALITQTLVYPEKKIQKEFPIKNPVQSILFIGDITWEPNKNAVIWFVEKIFPHILKHVPTINFTVVGKIEPSFQKKIEKNKQITIKGYQKKIDPFLKKASVFILPFQSGAGVRIKALTALSHGIPLVSTTIGTQGLSLQKNIDYLHANREKIFADKIMLILQNKKIAQILSKRSQRYIQKHHSYTNNVIFLKRYKKFIQVFR